MVSFSGNSSSSGDSNANSNLHTKVIPAILLGALFMTWVFSIFCRRRIPNGDAGVGNNDPEGFNTEPTRGLDQTVIESFPVVSFSVVKGLEAQVNWSGCAVCLSEFEEKEMVRLLTHCNHAFHPNCVDMWLCSHSTCPLCRSTLLPVESSSNPTPSGLNIIGPNSLTQGTVAIDNLEDGSRNSGPVGGCMSDGVCSSKVVCKARSERWASITSMNRAPFLRTFSERYIPFCADI
ncbi:hypothetical protein SUGI_0705730 [Cryptomeria japonica]|uniref:RING-H2 finger protein ATL11-like n=1 Tax=Cryptomeria japonica TaxID=3369 RepID=UPI002414BA4F|nr:RING-H2 finger protein ATL11-like [Cryptomeria japonica]GLJ35078.1 hypothetical protein SUGI_0705730 [Cryptomeria japonica]